MRHGEVWAFHDGRKAVVVSVDDLLVGRPFWVPVTRVKVERPNPLLIATNDADPITGTAVVTQLTSTPKFVPAERVGMATGATMAAIGDGLRMLFGLS